MWHSNMMPAVCICSMHKSERLAKNLQHQQRGRGELCHCRRDEDAALVRGGVANAHGEDGGLHALLALRKAVLADIGGAGGARGGERRTLRSATCSVSHSELPEQQQQWHNDPMCLTGRARKGAPPACCRSERPRPPTPTPPAQLARRRLKPPMLRGLAIVGSWSERRSF